MPTFPFYIPSGVNIYPQESGATLGTLASPFGQVHAHDIFVSGNIAGNIVPNTSGSSNLGSTNNPYQYVYGGGLIGNDSVYIQTGDTGDILIAAEEGVQIDTQQQNISIVAYEGNVGIIGKSGLFLVVGNFPYTGTITISGSIIPGGSGVRNLGSSDHPFATVHSNQYATSFLTQTGGDVTIDWNAGTAQKLDFTGVASGTYTVGFSNGIAGSAYMLTTVQNVSGNATIAWSGTQVKWQGGVSGTMTAASGTTDLFSFAYDGANYLGSFSNNYF